MSWLHWIVSQSWRRNKKPRVHWFQLFMKQHHASSISLSSAFFLHNLQRVLTDLKNLQVLQTSSVSMEEWRILLHGKVANESVRQRIGNIGAMVKSRTFTIMCLLRNAEEVRLIFRFLISVITFLLLHLFLGRVAPKFLHSY